MELATLLNGLMFVAGMFILIGCCNLMDYGLRTMAETKADRAEAERFRKWGLPPARH